MTSGGSLDHSEHQYMVDGPITRGDAFIDYDGDSDREWRTVALATMRRGGRGIVALDITQADPTGGSPDYIPSVSTFPGCSDGSTTGCRGEYPKVLWEFTDALDEDANGEWDLGWTWSKPAIARIPVYNSSDPQLPNDVFVAFFGGGWDPTNSDSTGNFFYGVDLATGAVVYKENMNVDLPGGVTALDSDIDGFHDRIYFADSDGGVHRLQFPSPTSSSATGADAGSRTRIFDFRAASAGFVDRQEFFTRPIPVPVLFSGATYTWGLVLGSGDRADLKREDSGIDHVYFLIDAGDTTTRGEGDLLAVDYTELDGSFECETDALTPPYYGWYLSLRDTEKVVNEASVFNGYVFVATFDPSTATATDPPNSCEGSSGEETTEEGDVVCRAAGIGRGYQLWYECGLGKYDEFNDILTGQEIVSIDGESNVVWTDTFPEQKDYEAPLLESREHSVMNWRQE
jgi:Tfp pilus tip-associated adhesin PilY1